MFVFVLRKDCPKVWKEKEKVCTLIEEIYVSKWAISLYIGVIYNLEEAAHPPSPVSIVCLGLGAWREKDQIHEMMRGSVYMPKDLLLWLTLFISQSKQSALTRMGTLIRTKVLKILRVACVFTQRALCDGKCQLRPPFSCQFCGELWTIRPTSAGFSVFVPDWHWWPFSAKSGDNFLKDSLYQMLSAVHPTLSLL